MELVKEVIVKPLCDGCYHIAKAVVRIPSEIVIVPPGKRLCLCEDCLIKALKLLGWEPSVALENVLKKGA